MTDYNVYRKYNCNLKCPKFKADKQFRCPHCLIDTADIGTLNVTSQFNIGNVQTFAGSFTTSTTHTFTSTQLPCLGETSCNGELSLYLNNDTYANVTMAAIVRAKNTTIQALIYQRVGNFTSVEMAISGDTIVVTCSPAATCNWIFRGL